MAIGEGGGAVRTCPRRGANVAAFWAFDAAAEMRMRPLWASGCADGKGRMQTLGAGRLVLLVGGLWGADFNVGTNAHLTPSNKYKPIFVKAEAVISSGPQGQKTLFLRGRTSRAPWVQLHCGTLWPLLLKFRGVCACGWTAAGCCRQAVPLASSGGVTACRVPASRAADAQPCRLELGRPSATSSSLPSLWRIWTRRRRR